ncbi:MAG: phosphatase PAP2 family protein [Ruminococcaceae bacterium]|nr:phosphatase PAP2 family protein [Oscillospiraceae bacterium]
MSNIELSILNFIRDNLTHPILDGVMKFITFFGDAGWFWIVLGVALLFFKKTRKMGITVCFALLLNLILCNITLKPLVARIRPYDLAEGIELIISKPSDFSFPSGHTSASFAAAAGVFAHNKKYGAFALIFAFLIAISRLYLYVHFPTDVLAGAIVGAFCAMVSYYTFKAIFKKLA